MPLAPKLRNEMFERVKLILEKHCPPLVVSKNKSNVFEVMGNVPVPYGSKKVIVPGMYFASVVERKDKVSFYFFPIYFHTDEFKELAPVAMKCLKGKTCFHFTKPDHIVEKELIAMMKKGLQAWKKEGYLK
jgi:hypothetical protein